MPSHLNDNFIQNRIKKCKSHLQDNITNHSNTEYRVLQWGIYQDDYKNTLNKLSDCHDITSSELVKKFFGTTSFGNFLKVDRDADTVIISCIDEATQFGELDYIENLNNERVELDINNKYILDIAGSGAYNYKCRRFENCIDLDSAEKIEDQRLDTLAFKIISWCKHRRVKKIIVTYHSNCGAVNLRMSNYPGLNYSQQDPIDVAKQCAKRLANKFQEYTNEFEIEIYTALIGSETMCKIRPEKMHNALGVCLNLDSHISSEKLDVLTNINFFNVLGLSDFEYSRQKFDNINTVKHALKNLKIVFSIVLGEHGWGSEYINERNPFIVLITYRDELQKMQAEEIRLKTMEENISTRVILINTSK